MTAGIGSWPAARISLHSARDEHEDTPFAWLPEAWSALDGLRPGGDEPSTLPALRAAVEARWPGARLGLLWRENKGVAGFIAWDEPGDCTIVHALAVRREWRNVGYGADAVDLLAARRPRQALTAAIPRWNGLAIYFWLRTGFRPIRIDEVADRATDPDALWMVRAPDALSGASDL
jgi:GNAT superfamily N-acetyltransferase